MQRTPFAGLTRLGPDDALSLDGFSFQDINPAVIDALLRVGAITHRHDAHMAMPNPATDPTVALLATGGSIPSDTSIYVGYTLIDADGGESILNPSPQVVTTQAGLTPPDGPDLALDTTAGTLLAGTYDYALTVTDGAGGESALGTFTEIEIPYGGTGTNRVVVSGLLALVAASGGTGWRLWRQIDGGGWNRVATGSTDTVTDDGTLCPDCNEEPPTDGVGDTNSTSQLEVTVPDPGGFGATGFRIYASLDGTFANPSLLADLPTSDFGVLQTFPTLNLLDGEPPAVSRCLPGAFLIDPNVEIDWSMFTHTPVNAAGGTAPAFSAGWSAAGTPAGQLNYWMDMLGVIHFEGAAQKATAPANGDVIFTLGWTPPIPRRLVAASGDGASRVAGALDIATNGDVVWRGGATGAGNWISFDGLTFTL